MNNVVDPYQVLGLSFNANPTDSVISSAYRKRSLEVHPDKNRDRVEWAKVEFQKIVEAYGVLCDPVRRAEIDARLEQHAAAAAQEKLRSDVQKRLKRDLEEREAAHEIKKTVSVSKAKSFTPAELDDLAQANRRFAEEYTRKHQIFKDSNATLRTARLQTDLRCCILVTWSPRAPLEAAQIEALCAPFGFVRFSTFWNAGAVVVLTSSSAANVFTQSPWKELGYDFWVCKAVKETDALSWKNQVVPADRFASLDDYAQAVHDYFV
eukprot:ANDGO_01368.mRNA.1 putative J domain-containing protein C1071.09c